MQNFFLDHIEIIFLVIIIAFFACMVSRLMKITHKINPSRNSTDTILNNSQTNTVQPNIPPSTAPENNNNQDNRPNQ